MVRFSLAAALFALLLVPSAPSATTSSGGPFSLSVQALLGGQNTDIYLRVASDTAQLPDRLDKVQLKAFSPDDGHLSTENLFDVPLDRGIAVLRRVGLARGDRVEVNAHAKDGSQDKLVADTHVAFRPDLKVELTAPASVVRKQMF